MKRILLSLMAAAAVAAALLAGCSQAAPAPAPTQAPAAQPKAVEPTKASAPAPAPTVAPAAPTKAPAPAQLTAAPAAKVNWPEKGKSITLIVPFAAGGPVDVSARILQPAMEKELGVPIQVVNRAGASAAIGISELVKAKPDGYTVLSANQPGTGNTYLDPAIKVEYGRKDILPIAMYDSHPNSLVASSTGKVKDLKGMIDAVKADPKSITIGGVGLSSAGTFVLMQLEELNGVKFTIAQFDGAAPALTALLGGHVDVITANITAVVSQFRAGGVTIVGVTDSQPSKFLPGVKTFIDQGYQIVSASTEGLIAPAGTPKEIVDLWANAVKKALADPTVQKKLDDMAYDIRYLGPEDYAKDWDQTDAVYARLFPRLRQSQK